MQYILAGLVVFACMRITIIYEKTVRPTSEDIRLRAIILVNGIWMLAAMIRVADYIIQSRL